MEFRELASDEQAVSPVIGVILMVAITVILAAVIGTFVLGLGDQVQNTTPQASFGFDVAANAGSVTVVHQSGDSIDAASLSISSTETFDSPDIGSATTSASWDNFVSDSEVSAGDSATINAAGDGSFAGDTIRIIYDSPNSDNTATLATKEISS